MDPSTSHDHPKADKPHKAYDEVVYLHNHHGEGHGFVLAGLMSGNSLGC